MPARRSASVTLGLPGGHGLTLEAAPANIRNVVLVAGAAVLSGLVVLTRRRRRGDGVRRRVVRRLDRIAPRVRFDARRFCAGEVINSDCAYFHIWKVLSDRKDGRLGFCVDY